MLDLILVGAAASGSVWNAIVTDFSNIGSPSALAAFGQVLMIDIMLAG